MSYNPDWKSVAECISCYHIIDNFGLTFVKVCPKCGFGNVNNPKTIWKIRTVRFISSSIWWKPSTWQDGTLEFKDGEKKIIRKGQICLVLIDEKQDLPFDN